MFLVTICLIFFSSFLVVVLVVSYPCMCVCVWIEFWLPEKKLGLFSLFLLFRAWLHWSVLMFNLSWCSILLCWWIKLLIQMMMINISIWIKNFDYETFEQIELMLMNFTRYFHHFIHTHVNQLFFVGCDFIFHSFRCHSIHFSLSILLLLTTITKKKSFQIEK